MSKFRVKFLILKHINLLRLKFVANPFLYFRYAQYKVWGITQTVALGTHCVQEQICFRKVFFFFQNLAYKNKFLVLAFIKRKSVWITKHLFLVGMSGLEPPTPTLSEKCMFLSGFIRTVLNVPKIKAFVHLKKSFDVKQKCTLDIS